MRLEVSRAILALMGERKLGSIERNGHEKDNLIGGEKHPFELPVTPGFDVGTWRRTRDHCYDSASDAGAELFRLVDAH